MTGMAADGGTIGGFAHVRQSIAEILTTPIGSRVMRRDFGSEVTDLIDRPMTARVVMAVFAAVAAALEPRRVGGSWYGEPRFRLGSVEVLEPRADGSLRLALTGTYYPNGHLGDFSLSQADLTFEVEA